MDQNFSLMAQSRANYYTAGSPVQFVRVELLKGLSLIHISEPTRPY